MYLPAGVFLIKVGELVLLFPVVSIRKVDNKSQTGKLSIHIYEEPVQENNNVFWLTNIKFYLIIAILSSKNCGSS